MTQLAMARGEGVSLRGPGQVCGAWWPQQLSLMGFLPIPTVPPQIAGPWELPTQVSVVQDGVTTLECNATGKPPPTVTWEQDGQPVGGELGLQLQNQGQSLRVERAQAAHTGRYSCVAENLAGRAERRFELSVLGEDRQLLEEGGLRQMRAGKAGSISRCSPQAVILGSHLFFLESGL